MSWNVNRFWRGMVTGMLVGMAMGVLLVPQMGDTRDALMDATRNLADRAGRVLRRSSEEVREAMES